VGVTSAAARSSSSVVVGYLVRVVVGVWRWEVVMSVPQGEARGPEWGMGRVVAMARGPAAWERGWGWGVAGGQPPWEAANTADFEGAAIINQCKLDACSCIHICGQAKTSLSPKVWDLIFKGSLSQTGLDAAEMRWSEFVPGTLGEATTPGGEG